MGTFEARLASPHTHVGTRPRTRLPRQQAPALNNTRMHVRASSQSLPSTYPSSIQDVPKARACGCSHRGPAGGSGPVPRGWPAPLRRPAPPLRTPLGGGAEEGLAGPGGPRGTGGARRRRRRPLPVCWLGWVGWGERGGWKEGPWEGSAHRDCLQGRRASYQEVSVVLLCPVDRGHGRVGWGGGGDGGWREAPPYLFF